MSFPEDYFDRKYESLKKEILESLGTPEKIWPTFTGTINTSNIYMQMFKDAIERQEQVYEKNITGKNTKFK